ncbi:MAG: response regulator [Bacteroidetes bacterium]|nr:MAG: response regulator [Bacteroidota bacterium]
METGITHILLIEDEKKDVVLLKSYLREVDPLGKSYELATARSLEEGLEILAKGGIHITLLDLGLPDSLGFATFERYMSRYPETPVIVLTSNQDEEMGRRAVSRGAQDFLDKMSLNGSLLRRAISYAIERKNMLLRLEQAQELARMGTWELSPQTGEIQVSAQLLRLLGNPSPVPHVLDELLAFVHPDDRDRVQERLAQAVRQGRDFRLDHRLELPGGKIRFVTMQGRASQEQGGRVMCSLQDITDRYTMEQLAREKELAERSAKLRQEFLAKTSHEIRTPLNPILLLTEFLLKTELTKTQQEHLRAIKNAGETLRALVNDILDLSKIEAGKVEFHNNRFKLKEVLDTVRDMMGLSAQEKGLDLIFSLDPDIPEALNGDTMRLTQILMNLVGNAIKFTHRGYIRISASLIDRQEAKASIRFVVSDSGIGIPKDKLQSIFDSFQQLDSGLSRQESGTGLGLTIVRQLVILQGGTITVESEVGEGSSFTFDLDYGIEEAEDEEERLMEAEAAHASNAAQLRGVRILLVEDNPLNQMVTRKLLQSWGVKLDIANNGREGVERLRDHSYDLVLMDVQMPEMDGYEATRVIRREFSPPASEVPILALTANAFSGSNDACFAAGMNDYLVKPIQIRELFAKIATYIRKGPDDLSV